MGGFDDLDQAVADEDDPEDEPEPEVELDEELESHDREPATTTSDDEGSEDDEEKSPTTVADTNETPAFEFSETTQQQLYVRPDIWSEWEDLRRFEVERELADRGIRNVEGRELDEAALHVLLEHPDAVADYVEALRNGDVSH
jgi:hypothetical protein